MALQPLRGGGKIDNSVDTSVSIQKSEDIDDFFDDSLSNGNNLTYLRK